MFGKKAETEVVEEVEHELKFKEWFNLKGIRSEIKNIHWLTKKELFIIGKSIFRSGVSYK